MSSDPPNGLDPESIPQLVFLTFDDAISDWMIPTYQEIFGNRTNPNGCPIKATFYVTHENTNYRLVNEFYNKGHEIASHTVTYILLIFLAIFFSNVLIRENEISFLAIKTIWTTGKILA